MLTEFAGSPARYQAWLTAIRNTHQRRIRVDVMNLEEKVLGSLTPIFYGGDVTIDTTRDTSRVLSLQLFDHTSSIAFEPDEGDMPIYLSRMIRVWMETYVPALGEWVGPPVFTGPVVDFDRDDVIVSLTCEGKERLSLGQFGKSRTWARKSKATDVIKALLRETGETRLGQIPNLKATLPEKTTVTRMDSPWKEAVKIARSIDRVLFYDGYGRVQLRRQPSKPGLRLTSVDLASAVAVDRNPEALINRWIVLGAKPRGSKKRVSADIRLPRSHKASGHNLGRNDEPRWLIDQEENSKIKTKAAAAARARKKRDRAIVEEDSRSTTCLPMPQLEEFDLVAAVTREGASRLRVKQATLPLGLDSSPMSIGALSRTKARTRSRGKGHRGGLGFAQVRSLSRD